MFETKPAHPTDLVADHPTSRSRRANDSSIAGRGQDRMQMEAACVDLICQFESMLTRSARQSAGGYFGEVVPIVDRGLELALQFGQSHLDGQPLNALNERVAEARECSHRLAGAVTSVEWRTLRRIIGRRCATEMDVLRIHGQLGTAVGMVLVTALGPAIEKLGPHDRSAAEVMRIVQLFISELRDRW